MLLRSLFVLLLFFALAETMVHGAHALAQVILRRAAASAVHDALTTATFAAQGAIAAAIAAGADPRSVTPIAPSPSATCVASGQAGCAIEAGAAVRFAAIAQATPMACASDGCAVYEQGNDAVAEGRIGATLSAQAFSPSGAVLARRTQTVVFRTWRVAPYAALSGSADGSLGAFNASAAGADAGEVPAGTAPGTLIDVLYQNRATGATLPANVWHPQADGSALNAPPAWSP
jgi:hypothetical protein